MDTISWFWSLDKEDLLRRLNSKLGGLSQDQASRVIAGQKEKNKPFERWKADLALLLSQYKSPLVLLLVFAAILSMVLKEYSDSTIIILVLLLTGILGFIQERSAGRAVDRLRMLVSNKTLVRRDTIEREIPIDEVVPGDIILLNAGDIIPADSIILESNDLHVNEAMLTGESFPAEKTAGICQADSTLSGVTNSVFKGTSVINGSATVLAVNTGVNTEVGKIAARLSRNVLETSFERGIRQFGYLLMKITVIMALLILILNILLHKAVIDSLLFGLALAVGMAPELLPAIITVTLAAGAKRMASKRVIVKKLSAIQNLGEMNILCSDKTGTLTEGVVRVHSTVGVTGEYNFKVKQYAFYNSFFETGFSNPIDEALRHMDNMNAASCSKHDEIPYDFIRKRLSVFIQNEEGNIFITKGALINVLQCCNRAEMFDGSIVPIEKQNEKIEELYEQYSSEGYRTIAVSYKPMEIGSVINKSCECDMIFLGFITLFDPPKAGIDVSIDRLRASGIRLKLITGDNHLVAKHVGASIGMNTEEILRGNEIHNIAPEALARKVEKIEIFAEIEPSQKDAIISALQKCGYTVGYLGDGINDASALRIADVGISVDSAVDVAKEAAPIVLLEKDLSVILDGVMEGRKTFVNTIKFIFVNTSANFGNMVSMAVASLFLPFLPLLPAQILLNNFLADIPALAIASDKVDAELLEKPRRWNLSYIKRFMIIFGLQSSIFDFLTFGLLLFVFHTTPETFRSGWFVESILTEILILLIIRTRRPFLKSRPSKFLFFVSLAIFCLAILLPYLPFAKSFDLYPLPGRLLVSILAITALYIGSSELVKKYFMKDW